MIEASSAPPPLLGIVQQHVDEAAALHRQRSRLVDAPHMRLHLLRRHDDRIAAHLDGIAVAGAVGRHLVESVEIQLGGGEVFVGGVIAIQSRNGGAFDKLIEAAATSPDAARGLVAALGWASAADLRGITARLLTSQDDAVRAFGLAACAMHQVDPGPSLAPALANGSATLIRRALDVAAQCGRTDLLPACLSLGSEVEFVGPALLAAIRLGDRGTAANGLRDLALRRDAFGIDALPWVLAALQAGQGAEVLKAISAQPEATRSVIFGLGMVGLASYVPWLIEQCAAGPHARLAAQSLAFITGVDLVLLGLDKPRPPDAEPGSHDDPLQDDVALHADEDLPWPDAAKLAEWWRLEAPRFNAGARLFLGAPLDSAHCVQSLRSSYQRQRVWAARHLSLLQPGTKLFPTRAPAWRQQRWLAAMGA